MSQNEHTITCTCIWHVCVCDWPDLHPVEVVELDGNGISHNLMHEIQCLCQLKSGRIAAACGSGLHLLSKSGPG